MGTLDSRAATDRTTWLLAFAALSGVLAGGGLWFSMLSDVDYSTPSEEQSIGTLLVLLVVILIAISTLPLLGLRGASTASDRGFTWRVLAFVPSWALAVLAL